MLGGRTYLRMDEFVYQPEELFTELLEKHIVAN